MGCVQSLGFDAPFGHLALEFFDEMILARYDTESRGIDGREAEILTEHGADLRFRQEYSQHRSCRHLLHESSSNRYYFQRIFEREYPGQTSCDIFADAVANHDIRLQSP